jgi:hypothetical protein
MVPVGKADFPLPFKQALEYCAPVREAWNIVHIGMLLPEAHQVYVCADNCMRGVTMTAAEMGEVERFHCVIINERDMLYTNLDEITIEGVTDVLNKLDKLPPAVLLFTVCVHHFLSSDIDHIYRELESRFPSINFIRCWMDPVMQKNHLFPDVVERNAMLDKVPERDVNPNLVNVFGADIKLDTDSELEEMINKAGRKVHEFPRFESYEDYLKIGEGRLNITTYPAFKYGAENYSEKTGRPHLYMPASFNYEEIDTELKELSEALDTDMPDTDALKDRCEKRLNELKKELGETPIVLDYMAHTRPLGLARMLLTHGMKVKRIYLDAVMGEEEGDFTYLKENYPDLELCATVRPVMRVLDRKSDEKTLAIGPKAAFFADTQYFVDQIECGGLWGYAGIMKLCDKISDGFNNPKEVKKAVSIKGAGNRCLPFE